MHTNNLLVDIYIDIHVAMKMNLLFVHLEDFFTFINTMI